MKINITILAIFGIVIMIAFVAVYSWYHPAEILSKTQFTALPPIPTAANIPTVNIPVNHIVALDKKTVSKKLKLPDEIANDEKEQVVATAQTPATDTTGKTDIVAVTDTDTGKTEIVAKQEPLSFFALENNKAIGLRYGFGSSSKINYEADAYVRWDVVRLGSVHLGLYGEVNSLGDGKAMIQAEYRW